MNISGKTGALLLFPSGQMLSIVSSLMIWKCVDNNCTLLQQPVWRNAGLGTGWTNRTSGANHAGEESWCLYHYNHYITLHYITITTEDGNTTTFNLGKDFLIVKKIFLITAGRIIRGSPCNYDTNQFPNWCFPPTPLFTLYSPHHIPTSLVAGLTEPVNKFICQGVKYIF